MYTTKKVYIKKKANSINLVERKELKILRTGGDVGPDQNWTNVTLSFYTLRATTMQMDLALASKEGR